MKILILGASGFVGTALFEGLRNFGTIVGTSRKITSNFFRFDLKNEENLNLLDEEFDYIIDCIVDYSLNLNNKIKNDLLFKEAMLKRITVSPSHLISISSISSLEENKFLSDYNISKYLSDQLIHFYKETHGLSVTVLRFPQIIDIQGKASHAQPGFYYFVNALCNNLTLNVFGNPKIKRAYIPIECIVDVVKKTINEKINGTHNLILNKTYSFQEIIEYFCFQLTYDKNKINYQPEKKITKYYIPESSEKFQDVLQKYSPLNDYFQKIIYAKKKV